MIVEKNSSQINQMLEDTVQIKDGVSSFPPVAFMYVASNDIVPPWWSISRDKTLRQIAKRNDNYAGAKNKVISRLQSAEFRVLPRDETVRAHRNLADVYQSNLIEMSAFGNGFDDFLSKYLDDYFDQDNGTFVEIVSDGDKDTELQPNSMRWLGNLDASRCTRTGNIIFPVLYRRKDGKLIKFHHSRVLFTSSNPSNIDEMFGVGFCWLSRCIHANQNLYDMAVYKQEKMGSRPKSQMMIGQGGLSGRDIVNAYKMYNSQMDNQGLKRYANTIVLGDSTKPEADVLVKDLTQTDIFDEKTSTEIGMFTIALAGGFPPRDFWPATTTGATRSDAEFQNAIGASGYQSIAKILSIMIGGPHGTNKSLLPRFLPPSLKLEVDLIDDNAEKGKAEVKEARAKTWVVLLDSSLSSERVTREQMLGVGDITKSQFETLELESGRLPSGDSVLILFVSDNFQDMFDIPFDNILNIQENMGNVDEIIRAIDNNIIKMDIIIANIGAQKAITKARQSKRALEMLKVSYVSSQAEIQEQQEEEIKPDDIEIEDDQDDQDTDNNFEKLRKEIKQTTGVGLPDDVDDYDEQLNDLYEQAQNGELSQDEFESELEDLVIASLTALFLLGAGISGEDLTDTEREFLATQLQPSLDSISGLADDIYSGKFVPEENGGGGNDISSRLGLWAGAGGSIFYAGMLFDKDDNFLEWVWNPLKDHCSDCERLNGQVHRASEWRNSGWWPKITRLICFGLKCGCGFRRVSGPSVGSF